MIGLDVSQDASVAGLPDRGLGRVAQIHDQVFEMPGLDERLILLGDEVEHDFRQEECALDVEVVAFLVIELLHLIEDSLGVGEELLLVILRQGGEPLDGLGLEGQRALAEAFGQKLVIVGVKAGHCPAYE